MNTNFILIHKTPSSFLIFEYNKLENAQHKMKEMYEASKKDYELLSDEHKFFSSIEEREAFIKLDNSVYEWKIISICNLPSDKPFIDADFRFMGIEIQRREEKISVEGLTQYNRLRGYVSNDESDLSLLDGFTECFVTRETFNGVPNKFYRGNIHPENTSYTTVYVPKKYAERFLPNEPYDCVCTLKDGIVQVYSDAWECFLEHFDGEVDPESEPYLRKWFELSGEDYLQRNNVFKYENHYFSGVGETSLEELKNSLRPY